MNSEYGMYSSPSSITIDLFFPRSSASDRFHVKPKVGSVARLLGKDLATVGMIARGEPIQP